MTTEELRDKICEILDENKGVNIKIIDFENESSVADYLSFVPQLVLHT